MTVFAQFGSYSVGQIAILIIVILAVCGLVMVAVRQFGIAIPQWVIQVLSILVVAIVCIAAIRFVLGM